MAKYKSEIMQVVHHGVTDLFDSGHVSKETMKEFDERCLTPAEATSPDNTEAPET